MFLKRANQAKAFESMIISSQRVSDATATSLPLVFVVAVARNNVIGRDGTLPWRMPSDLKRFRAATLGKPMIMGRKTFASIGKPLPGRETIVVTRDPIVCTVPDVFVVHDIESAVKLGKERARTMAATEVIVAGGAEIFAALLPRADRIILTEIDLAPEGSEVWPTLDPQDWRETGREDVPRGPNDDAGFTIRTLERIIK